MASPEPPRTTLDRYELVERIAVGGMAEVFRAKAFGAHGFEKVLAIKRILPDLARDPEFESRFISEAKLAVALAHANIVQVLDFGRFGGTLYIAMEYVDGPDLAALLRALAEQGRRVPVSAALHIAMEMAKGLDFAHRNGVVHRDVSPSNILLSRSGEVKIADFGIAQAAEAAPANSNVRRIMGKWRYMSPEQARGEKLDPRSDLFSLGSVLYEMFTGKKLFPGDEIEDVVRNVREMPIPPPSSVRAEVPEALDAVLARCLEREPTRRWGTASELYRVLLELSYARTLVVTAADVAELIAEAMPPVRAVGTPVGGAAGSGGSHPGGSGGSAGSGPRISKSQRAVDDLIRAELFGGAGAVTDDDLTSEISRVTAQSPGPPKDGMSDAATQTTFVFRGVGPDGITQYGEVPAGAAPEASLASELVRPLGERTDALPVAPPPTVTNEKTPVTATAPTPIQPTDVRTQTAPVQLPRRRLPVVVAALAGLAALGGFVAWRSLGTGEEPAHRSVPPLLPSAAPGQLEVVTEPAGATVLLDGVEQPERTPTLLSVGGERHRLELRLAGRRTFHGEVAVRPGERVRYERPLEPARASLRVVTDPPDAEIRLDGRVLGRSPLSLVDLPADAASHVLRLSRPGFRDLDLEVELTDAASVVVERTLEPEVRWGHINLQVEPWAYVYFDGKRIAEAPVAGLKLPVGKQKLRLVNPALHAEKNVIVDVPGKGIGSASFTME